MLMRRLASFFAGCAWPRRVLKRSCLPLAFVCPTRRLGGEKGARAVGVARVQERPAGGGEGGYVTRPPRQRALTRDTRRTNTHTAAQKKSAEVPAPVGGIGGLVGPGLGWHSFLFFSIHVAHMWRCLPVCRQAPFFGGGGGASSCREKKRMGRRGRGGCFMRCTRI